MKSRGFKEECAAMTFLVAVAAFYFVPVLAKGSREIVGSPGGDIWSQFFYWRHFGFATLARGELPLWNPYVFSGTPFIAGMQSAVFYPLNVLFLIFPTSLAINFGSALHCFLASLFTYLYGRYMRLGRSASLVAAVSFGYGAPCVFHIYSGHLINVSAMIWLPLILLGVEAWLRTRKLQYALLSGIVLAIQILAGHPQYLFYSTIAVCIYFLLNLVAGKELRPVVPLLAGFGAFLITGVMLSAIQLVPAWELANFSVREAATYEFVSSFSLAPEKLITLILPDVFGDIVTVPYWGKYYLWEMSVYLGILAAFLALAGVVLNRSRSCMIFSCMAILSLLLALGGYTPLLPILYNYVPGFNWFRGLSKFVFVFGFACSMLAGYGLQQIIELSRMKNRKAWYLAYAILLSSAVLVVLGILLAHFGADFWTGLVASYSRGEERYSAIPSLTDAFLGRSRDLASGAFFRAGGLLSLFGTALLLGLRFLAHPSTFVGVAAAALAAFDLWSFGARYLVTFDARLPYMDPELKAFLVSEPQPFRIATPLIPFLNIGLMEEIENVGGYDPVVLRHYSEYINLAQGLPVDAPNLVMAIRRTSSLLDLLNVRYYVLPARANLQIPHLELAFENGRFKVYRNESALPRTLVVHDAWVAKSREATLRALSSPEFDPLAYAIVEERIDGLPYGNRIKSPPPRILRYSASRILVEAETQKSGLLILADSYYPGWEALVDGRPAKVYRANHVMRAVFLPPGKHLVEFSYEPGSFKAGAFISLAGIVSLLVWWIVNTQFHKSAVDPSRQWKVDA
jgi:hypothetical protein